MSRRALKTFLPDYLRNRGFGHELSKYFDNIYCINLDSRPDRWRYVCKHFSKFGLKNKVERFSAIDIRNNPELKKQEKLLQENFSLLAMCGCMLSHRSIIENAWAKGFKNVLVFEDDVRILQDNIVFLKESLNELDNLDWDVFYLGATYLWPLKTISSYLVNVHNGAYATHAISYNNTVYERILDLLPSNPKEFLESGQFEVNALDKWLQSNLFDHGKFYGTNPIMVVQALQESDIAFNQQGGIEQRQISLFEKNTQ